MQYIPLERPEGRIEVKRGESGSQTKCMCVAQSHIRQFLDSDQHIELIDFNICEAPPLLPAAKR